MNMQNWKQQIKENKYKLFLSVIIILIAYIINYIANYYVVNKAQVSCVSDLILDYFGPYNLNLIFSYGFLLFFFVIIFYSLILKVKESLYLSCQFSFLIIIRAIFITLTHLKTPYDAVGGNFPWIFSILKSTNDQFFSGHVAIPFLAFLLFKGKIRYLFLICSIIMAITVLAMHQHYTIDVFSAFFIAYGCYKIVDWLFKKVNIPPSG